MRPCIQIPVPLKKCKVLSSNSGTERKKEKKKGKKGKKKERKKESERASQ
jgi:hypothetical protein